MSIFINGLDMPKDDCIRIVLYPNGLVVKSNAIDYEEFEATNIPPHGALIDSDKLVALCDIMADKCDGIGVSIWHQFKTTVEWSPIVIPAEGGI